MFSHNKNTFDAVDALWFVTYKPDAEVELQNIRKVPIQSRDQIQQISEDPEHNGILKCVALNAAWTIYIMTLDFLTLKLMFRNTSFHS